MGDDFINRQLFIDNRNMESCIETLINILQEYFASKNFKRNPIIEEVDRILAICPNGKWLTIFDSIDFEDDVINFELYEDLSKFISITFTTLNIFVCDSAYIEIKVFEKGKQTDIYKSNKGLFESWKDNIERDKYKGNEHIWAKFLEDTNGKSKLRGIWDSDKYAMNILDDLSHLLEWDTNLISTGYSIGYDGIPVLYKEHLAEDTDLLKKFSEIAFRNYE
jgi:hypothetical protein